MIVDAKKVELVACWYEGSSSNDVVSADDQLEQKRKIENVSQDASQVSNQDI